MKYKVWICVESCDEEYEQYEDVEVPFAEVATLETEAEALVFVHRRVSTHKPKAPSNHSHPGKYSASRAHELSATPRGVHRHLAPPLALSA